jgi:hypothetical protein
MKFFWCGHAGILAGMLLALATKSPAGPTATVLFTDHFERGLGNRWQQVKFGTPTDYRVALDGTNFFLSAAASNSCSALMTRLSLKPPAHLFLRWCWRIDHTPANASDRAVRDYDHSARVLIAFDTLIGPPRSLNYLWANQEKIGTVMSHPLMSRAQMLVLETGNARAGEWVAEERDVTADWRRLFGTKAMSKIVGLGVLTDTDSTHTQVSAGYTNIELYSQ